MATGKQLGGMRLSKCDAFLRTCVYIFYFYVFLSVHIQHADSSHITGTWNTKDFFKFLIKFGFKKTDVHNSKDTSGYIFGNITAKTNFTQNVTFAVLDRGYFLEYYGNRTIVNKEKACTQMFNKISTIAYDSICYDQGEDFLRKVPCPKGNVCVDEDAPWNVVKGHQFTFVIEDLMQPR